MKKGIIVIILFSVCAGFVPLVQAASPMTTKLTRGIMTVASAPLEVPKQARAYWIEGAKKTPHVLVWIFCGVVKGLVNTVVRTASGTWDIVSFPLPLPKNYEPLVDTQKL